MIVSTNNGKDVNYSSFPFINTLLTEEQADKYNSPIIFKNSKNNIAELFGAAKKSKSDKEADSNTLIGSKNKNTEDASNSYDGKVSFMTNSFSSLVTAVGATGNRVTKTELIAYLQSLMADKAGDNSKEIAFLKNLIAQFDTLSNGTSYISSLDGTKEAQDYSTVTKDQVTPPIDIRI